MLAPEFSFRNGFRFFVLVALAAALSSCATRPEPQLVSDGSGRESSLPWNEQQKWESGGQFGAMADRLQSR